MVLEVQAVMSSLVGTGLGLSQACQPTVGSQDKDAYAGSETQNGSVVNKRGVCLMSTHQSKLLTVRMVWHVPMPGSQAPLPLATAPLPLDDPQPHTSSSPWQGERGREGCAPHPSRPPCRGNYYYCKKTRVGDMSYVARLVSLLVDLGTPDTWRPPHL